MFQVRPSFRHNLREAVLYHPFELAICVYSFVSLYAMTDLLINRKEVLSASQEGILSLPIGILWTWVYMGLIGTTLMVVGLGMSIFSRKGRAFEAAGLWLSASMWLSAGVAAFAINPIRVVSYGQLLAIGLACVLRIVALNKIGSVLAYTSEAEAE